MVFLEIRTPHHWNQHFSPGSSLLDSHAPAHPGQPLLRAAHEILKAKHRSVEECTRKPQPLPPAFLLPWPPQLSPASFPGSHTDYTARLTEASWQHHQTEPSVSPCECPTDIYGRLKKYLGWVRGGKVTGNKARSCKPHFKLNLPDQ